MKIFPREMENHTIQKSSGSSNDYVKAFPLKNLTPQQIESLERGDHLHLRKDQVGALSSLDLSECEKKGIMETNQDGDHIRLNKFSKEKLRDIISQKRNERSKK